MWLSGPSGRSPKGAMAAYVGADGLADYVASSRSRKASVRRLVRSRRHHVCRHRDSKCHASLRFLFGAIAPPPYALALGLADSGQALRRYLTHEIGIVVAANVRQRVCARGGSGDARQYRYRRPTRKRPRLSRPISSMDRRWSKNGKSSKGIMTFGGCGFGHD